MKDDEVLSLPFDQYQRYRLVADIVRLVEADGRKRAILDVGGRTGLLRKFLPDHSVALVDVEPSDIPDVVLGDGCRLPFADKSFDVVAAFDTLEHVPKDGRDAFVDECARVAREHVVLVGPYAHPAVDEAEELLLRFLEDQLGEKHRYLREHRANSLPSMEAVVDRLRGRGAKVATIAHGNVERWLGLMCLSLYMDHEPHLRPLATRMHRFWNEALHESDTGEPAYRHAVVASFVGEPPRVAYAAKSDALPSKVLAGARVLSTKLVEFDVARRDWREERARLREVASTLEQDLAGHKRALEESSRKEREALEVVATLRADLTGHVESLGEQAALLAAQRTAAERMQAELEADLARHKAEVSEREGRLAEHAQVELALQDELRQTREALVVVEADLAGHREVVASLRSEESALRVALEAGEAELEAVRARADELERSVQEHQLVLSDRERQLAEWPRVVAAKDALLAAELQARAELERDLAGHRALVAELRADLEGHEALVRDLRSEWRGLQDKLRAEAGLLVAERAASAALRHALEGERLQLAAALEREQELERLLGEHRAVVRDLSTDLEGHRAALSVARATILDKDGELEHRAAVLRREQAEHESTRVELAHERVVRADLEAQVERARQAIASQDAKIGELRAHLSNRWKSFKRALWLKRPLP